MRTVEHILPIKGNEALRWQQYLLDTLLACAGSLLVTAIIFTFQLYPCIPNISMFCTGGIPLATRWDPVWD